MRIDMKKLLAGEIANGRIAIEHSFDIKDGDYPFDTEIDGAVLTSPVRLNGEITDMGGYIRLSVDASVDYDTECARCLAPLSRTLTVTVERTVINEGSLENTAEEDADEYIEIVGGILDIGPCVVEELMMAFPSRELCSEECKGLCPKCGKNLNEGSCSCETKEIDPRLAVLKKLLDNQ